MVGCWPTRVEGRIPHRTGEGTVTRAETHPSEGVPKVSVVIPLHNKERFIERAVRSVLIQTEPDFELIVVDDGSTDGSAAVVRQIEDPRIRLVSQENRGAAHARNQGIAKARADLVAFLDADDRWLPDFLHTILCLRVRYPEAGACATAYCMCRPDGSLRSADLQALPPAPWEGLIPNYFRSATLGEGPITASSVAIPMAILCRFDGFTVGEWWGEDTDLWGKIALQYPIAFSREIGAVYHTHIGDRVSDREQPLDDNPFIATAEGAITAGAVDPSILPDLQEYIAKKNVQTAARNILAGRPDLARRQLHACRTRLFLRQKRKLMLLAWIPPALYKHYRAVRRAFSER